MSNSDKQSDKKQPQFENALEELETIVNSLESGELSLEDSLSTFERGIALTRQCQSALQEAEQRVSLLVEKDGELQEEAFDEPEE